MYKTILVPLDGSNRTEAILPHVENLARTNGARMGLLEVLKIDPVIGGIPGTSGMWGEDVLSSWRTEAQIYLAARQGEFLERGIDTSFIVEVGPVVETILNVAEREKADLIAMASHGRTGLMRAYYGSVAAGVLHGADRPLLLIRART